MPTMAKALYISMLCCALLVSWTSTAATAASSTNEVASSLKPIHPSRAMWVWDTKKILLEPAAREEFFSFVAQPKGQINTPIKRLFFSASWAIAPTATPAEQNALRTFLVAAHERGLAVDMLGGNPKWAAPTLDPALQQLLNNLATWQRTAGSGTAGSPNSAAFDGLQLDVEPYLLPGWPSFTHFAGWTGMASCVREFLNTNPDLNLAFGLALPIWLDQEKYLFLNQPLQVTADYVALMDYRDTAARIVKDAIGELAVADSLGRMVFVGVETKDVKGDPPSITFYQEGNALMEKELQTATPDLEKYTSFAGFAIHHYDTYKQLKP